MKILHTFIITLMAMSISALALAGHHEKGEAMEAAHDAMEEVEAAQDAMKEAAADNITEKKSKLMDY